MKVETPKQTERLEMANRLPKMELTKVTRGIIIALLVISFGFLAFFLSHGPAVHHGEEQILRGRCANLPAGLVRLAAWSEFGLWIFYQVIIAFILLWVAPRHLPRFRAWFNVLGLLFLTCAGTHFNGWLLFYWPVYRYDIYFRLFALVVGAVGMVTLYPLARQARLFPTWTRHQETLFSLREEVMRLQRELVVQLESDPTAVLKRLAKVEQIVTDLKQI